MSLITLSNIGKNYGADLILQGVNLRLGRGEKVGIVGKNGGGKTTLLRLILGREGADTGNIHIAKGVRIGYLSQITSLDESLTVREEAELSLAHLANAEEELRSTEARMADNPTDDDALEAYAMARDRFEFAGGDHARENLFFAVKAMGFSDSDLDKSVAVLSGGEKTRLSLAKLLASAPDVLALDEPTNHLDIRAVEWLENFLQRFPGAVLVVSHDRRMLENVAETIWEVEATKVTTYRGNYSDYRRKKDAILARQAVEYAQQQQEIERLEEFVRKYKAGDRSKQARSREKALARMDRVERPTQENVTMRARIESSGRSGRDVVVVERANKRYEDKVILDNVSLSVERGWRVGLVGANGVGKSTFVEMVTGDEQPDSGFVRPGHGVTLAYHRQDKDDFDPELSVLENFVELAPMPVGEARSHLAKYLFTGDDVFKPVSALSGGERSKLNMAVMVLSPANLLILDEPTNHLDVFSCDALADSLKKFPGTLLLVSHDRSLLDGATDHTLAFEGDGRLVLFEGNYAAFRADRELREQRAATQKTSAPAKVNPGVTKSASAPPTMNAHQLSKERQRLAKKVSAIEAEIETLEARVAEIESQLAAPRSADHAMELATAHVSAQESLNAKLAEWEEANNEADALGA